MNAPRRGPKQAGCEAACGRLALYRQYADLVAEQEAALDAGDLERFDEVSSAALDLQCRMGSTPVKSLADDPEAASSSFVEQLSDLLRSMARRNQRIQDRLGALKWEARQDIRRAVIERPMVRRYVEAGSDRVPSLDLKF